jgi:TPR repeat protein
MTIAPALSYYAPLRNMFEWAGDNGGVAHAAEIAAAKSNIEQLTAQLEHGDRKLARTRNEQGLVALRADDLSKAVQRFKSAHEADPVDVEVLNNLGYSELLAGIGDPGQHLVSSLLLDPGRTNAWGNLGHLFARHNALPEAQASFALALRFSGNPAKTLQFFKDQAAKDSESGLSRAVQQLLGQSWLDRLVAGSQNDSSSALGSIRRAAQAGDAQAQYSLGMRYNNGDGVARDSKQAGEWFQRAAAQGVAASQYDLAYLYETGEGVTRDFMQAALWYKKASDQGYAKAFANLGQLYESGLGVPKDDIQAIGWYRKGAERGDAVAQLNLGVFYAEGRGVARNDALASDWYRKAAEQGLVQAQNNLGRMYDAGLGVPKDFREAVKWYRRAAEQGHRTALYNLGAMVTNGDGVARDEVIAAMLFERAASLGHPNAARERDQLLRKLTEAQVAEVKRLAEQWKPGVALPMTSSSGSVVR